MLGLSMLRVTWRACDERYRQNRVWLWEEILFSIEWYHQIIFMTLLIWSNLNLMKTFILDHELSEKNAFWTKFEALKNEKRKRKWNLRPDKIWILSHSIIIIRDIQNITTNVTADRFWNLCLKWDHVRTEQVAGHVPSVWWTISPIWGMIM